MQTLETALIVLRLSAFVHQEDDLWVAGCPSLDVFSQGDSVEDAKESLQEAIELWIESCVERNTLADSLRELGWYRTPVDSKSPAESEVIGVVSLGRDHSAELGQEYPLEVTIPAYQAAIFSGTPSSAHC